MPRKESWVVVSPSLKGLREDAPHDGTFSAVQGHRLLESHPLHTQSASAPENTNNNLNSIRFFYPDKKVD